MNVLKYISQKGIRGTVQVLYQYKVDLVLQRVMGLVLRHRPLKRIIVIESHNDFDSNGGALYRYLIRNGYNETNQIVWLLKNPLDQELPPNVTAVPLRKPSIRKNYYKWVAKWFSSDNDCSEKLRKDQVSIYLGHGGFGLKNCRGYIKVPDSVDYVAVSSREVSGILADQLMLAPTDPRLRCIGYPYMDSFLNGEEGDLRKVTDQSYGKVILWMPTFRKGGGAGRQDSATIGKLGIPLIQDLETLDKVNEQLRRENTLLILKIHPMQDLEDLKVTDRSNIRVLTGKRVKELGIDNYRLMKDCDALISDYSSAAYDFLYRNGPIAYDFSDVANYKLGLCVEDPEEYMAGDKIMNVEDLSRFLHEVAEGEDPFYEKRQALRKKIFDYYDGESSRRAVELLGITK